MAEAFPAAVYLAGQRPVGIEAAVEHAAPGRAGLGQADVLQRHQFGDREAVVQFGQAELRARIVDARFGVRLARRHAGGVHVRAVPVRLLQLPAVGRGQLDGLDQDQRAAVQAAGDLGGGDDGAGGAVRHRTAIEQSDGVGHQRRAGGLFAADGLAQVRLGIVQGVGMAFHRGMGHGRLEVLPGHAVAGLVGTGQLREVARVAVRGQVHGRQRAARGQRQTGEAGVFQLFHPERQRDVRGAGGDRVDGAAKRFGAAGAEVLHARHADVGQAQGHGHGRAGLARADVVIVRRVPGRLDGARLDAGARERLGVGLDHQFFLAHVPAFAETGTAHRQNGDAILDSCSHQSVLSRPSARPALSRNSGGSRFAGRDP
ncbi:Uncharacterised protein [Bordetella pertussis]|nr:Uncharacterised protein [Bordetella pertussis]CFW62106.1 Uncharacterised protein [Bordetella pertussis]CPJ91877.1 Uncharacterised protein [Bordetella pertussis]CPP07004.1 Uncharacterised protein [Bordetella pertussis]CPP51696.1 Uncharacterised protein [Bordetella pertussis]